VEEREGWGGLTDLREKRERRKPKQGGTFLANQKRRMIPDETKKQTKMKGGKEGVRRGKKGNTVWITKWGSLELIGLTDIR